jgi:hypothetical protein
VINIAKQLFVVKGVDREDDLAYMSPYAEGKDGQPLANIAKMQATGRSWASVGPQNVYKLKPDAKTDYDWLRDEQGKVILDHVIPARKGEEFIHDNTPLTGFYVGSSVARWSTSNKLFRVKDPRGFTVEIPTDNLATLLHHTTVVNGVVQEECVWGREGNDHILLPINSEPYLITLDQMDTLANKLISIKDIEAGDWVKFFEDEYEYYYLGKVKATWNVRGYNYSYNHRYEREQKYGEWIEVVDDKWVGLFLRPWYSNGELRYSVETPSKPKIVEIVKHEPINPAVEEVSWYAPDRITNKAKIYDRYQAAERNLISLQVK